MPSVLSVEHAARTTAVAEAGETLLSLHAQEEPGVFYRTVLEGLSQAVLVVDARGRIVFANTSAAVLTGYTVEELREIGPGALLPMDNGRNASCQEKPQPSELEGAVEGEEVEIRRKNGQFHWAQLAVTPYRDAQGAGIGATLALSSIARQKSLERQNEVLHAEARAELGHIVGRSAVLQKVISQIATVAPTQASVLILGESGTGKELVARAVHDLGTRKLQPLVRVNCASIPKELFESEFFGHARGAFTGAIRDRVGRFELAHRGTLFLDEIGEIPLELQGKLLRVLQEGQFERLGEERTRTVDVRIVAATNRDLLAEAKAGRFRLDLYYRLSVFPIEVPALRERPEDIEALAGHFVEHSARRLGIPRPRLTRLSVQALLGYDWPGNVRELQNVVERAVILSQSRAGRLVFDLPALERRSAATTAVPIATATASALVNGEPAPLSLDELTVREREIVLTALQRTEWKIYGGDGAAALLALKPTTLVSMMKRLGIVRPTV